MAGLAMLHCATSVLALLAAICLALGVAASWAAAQDANVAPADPFLDLPVSEARDVVRREGRVLLLAFYAEPCEPCATLDRTIFADPGVRAWIRSSAVALRLTDAAELEASHAIGPKPTILLLDGQGHEIERLDALVSPSEFLAAMQEALLAGNGHEAARRRSADASAHLDVGRKLAMKGRGAEALREFLLVFDSTRDLPAWAEDRLHGLLREISRLIPVLPEAGAELALRRDAAAIALLEAPDTVGREAELLLTGRELMALDRTLGDLERTRQVWVELVQRGDAPVDVLATLFGEDLQAFLLAGKRYEEFLEGIGNSIAFVEERLENLQARGLGAQVDAGLRASLVSERNAVINLAGRCHEALLGLQRDDEADGLAQFVVALEPSAQSYLALALAAGRAGRSDLMRELIEAGLATLPEAEARTLRAHAQPRLQEGG